MSTPYVSLRQVLKQPLYSGSESWAESADQTPELTMNTADYRKEMKRRLIKVLETDLGVQSLQVGAFQMELSEDVPERHLLKATHYLLEQLRQEREPSKYISVLEECLTVLLNN